MTGDLCFELAGDHVVLRPMVREDAVTLRSIAFDEALWVHAAHPMRTHEDLERYVTEAVRARDQRGAVPFVTLLQDGTAVGSTRFSALDPVNRRVEIGWTWIARPWQRSAVNTEAKLLMLRHAFERWDCARVEFKTGTRNERSRMALRRLGAHEEGILRRHMLLADGSYRDTVYYSILDHEWPDVRRRLEGFLTSGA